ncbi:MAG: heme ABC transporter permease CcmC [Gammaproteobacteria bacterium]|nr:heme ABC transporter permease CcmC [Gammaproteobacteria bacterium]
MQWSWYYWASPKNFLALAQSWVGIFAWMAVITGALGLWFGLVVAPVDVQQGEVYRIIYWHVPASWMSMLIYVMMAFWSIILLAFRTKMAGVLVRSLAPTGAFMTLISLVSGALWGVPTWGTWWVWDARLTSQLILLFLYGGYLALTQSITDTQRADQAGALLSIVGVINIPIIYFSVVWWNTLHQGPSIRVGQSVSIDSSMLWGLGLMTVAFWTYTLACVLHRAGTIVKSRYL